VAAEVSGGNGVAWGGNEVEEGGNEEEEGGNEELADIGGRKEDSTSIVEEKKRRKGKRALEAEAMMTDAVNAAKAHAQKVTRSLEEGFLRLTSDASPSAPPRVHVSGLVAMEGAMLLHLDDERSLTNKLMDGVGIHIARPKSPAKSSSPPAAAALVGSPREPFAAPGALDGDVTADLDDTIGAVYRPVWLTLTGDMFLHGTGPPMSDGEVAGEVNGIDASSEVCSVQYSIDSSGV
jgi:hypothetical protein